MGWLFGFFSNPALLAGASAGSIPIIIHLLNKQRFKRTMWAAMHWLWAAHKKQSRRLQIEQLILLLIRVLILVLLALALARPALQAGMGLFQGRPSTYRIIVLDNSFSMSHQISGKPLFEQARERAIALVDDLNPGDEVDVLLMNADTTELTPKSELKHEDVIRDLKAVKLSDGITNIPRAIAKACELIVKRQSRNIRKEIIVLTDRTRTGWLVSGSPKTLDAVEETRIKEAFDDPRQRPGIWVIRLGSGNEKENLAISELEVDEKVVTSNVETQLSAVVRNFGTKTRKNVPVTLYLNGEKVTREELEQVEPTKPVTVIFRHTFIAPGAHALEARLEPDALPADDSVFLTVDAADEIKVLCVDGQQNIRKMASELDFLRQALAPSRAEETQSGRMPLSPVVISDGAFPETNLDPYRMVVLGNVRFIPRAKIVALEQFVQQGGALWIFLGDRVDPTIYNQELASLLPVQIDSAIGEADPNGPFESISDKLIDHPAIARFSGMRGLNLNQLHVYRRMRLKPRDDVDNKTVRTVLAYESGEPAAVEWTLGKGRVMLFGTTADKDWNNWPKQRHYMPLINFIALDLIRPEYLERNVMVGESFNFPLQRHELGAVRREGMKLTTPHGEPMQMELDTTTLSTSSPGTPYAGIYTADLPGERPRRVYFAANRDLEESDLDSIDVKELLAYIPQNEGQKLEQGRLFGVKILQEHITFMEDDLTQLLAELKKAASGREIWRWLIWCVLTLLLAESLLARRFGNFSR